MSVSEYVPLSEDLKYTNGTADFFAIDLYTATKASAAIPGQWCPSAASRSEASTGRGRRRHRERAGGGHARHGGKVSPMMQRESWPIFSLTRLSNAGGASAVAKSLWWRRPGEALAGRAANPLRINPCLGGV